jgi:hypothetical protein
MNAVKLNGSRVVYGQSKRCCNECTAARATREILGYMDYGRGNVKSNRWDK